MKQILGDRLKCLREEKGISQEDLATALGISRLSVGNYERSIRTPDAETIIKIAKYFGVSSDYLLGLSDVKSVDMDIKSVCEFTGLSERAVMQIRKINSGEVSYRIFSNPGAKEQITMRDTLDVTLCSSDFLRIITNFTELAQIVRRPEWMNDKDKCKKNMQDTMNEFRELGFELVPFNEYYEVLRSNAVNEFMGLITLVTAVVYSSRNLGKWEGGTNG